MKPRNLQIVMVLACLLGGSAPSTLTAEETPRPLALDGLDPVLLIEGRQVQGRENLTAADEHFSYRFADSASRERFLADPQRWGVQGDGTCPLSPGSAVNPSIFTVYAERIWAFASRGCVAEFHDDPTYWVDPPQYEQRNVAVWLYNGVDPLQFAGPAEVFATAANGDAFFLYTVAETSTDVTSGSFLAIRPEYTFANAPQPDILIVAGGGYGSIARNSEALAWLRRVSEKAVVLSIDNGAMVLALAGLLEGRQATTHHGSIDSLKRRVDPTGVHTDRRFVDNGNVITAAGGSAGIDAALHLVQRTIGAERALGAARMLEYAWTPDEPRGLVLQAAQQKPAAR